MFIAEFVMIFSRARSGALAQVFMLSKNITNSAIYPPTTSYKLDS